MSKPTTIVRRAVLGCALPLTLALLLFAAPASAAGPEWRLHAYGPDTITNGKPLTSIVWVENVGTVPLSGQMTVTHTFAPGIEPREPAIQGSPGWSEIHTCQIVGQESACEVEVEGLPPGAEIRLIYNTRALSAIGAVTDTVDADGGGMGSGQSLTQAMTVGPPEPFAIKAFAMEIPGADHAPAVQAGSAPLQAENALELRSAAMVVLGLGFQRVNAPIEHLRDVTVHVPAGFVGRPTATPVRCTAAELNEPYSPAENIQKISRCPQDSQVGVIRVMSGLAPSIVPLYNMVPPPGYPAAFGFFYQGLTITIVAKLRPADDGIDLISRNSPTTLVVPAVYPTIWGVPADGRHDYLRHLCMDGFEGNNKGQKCPSGAPPKPFLRLPTSCPGSDLPWSVDVDTYEQPGKLVHAETTTPATAGCAKVPFTPRFTLLPTTPAASAPTGLDATITVPQETQPANDPYGLNQADLRLAEVTLPEGMTINPSSADGLASCADDQLRLGLEGPSHCPDGSKIGSVELETPLLDHPLTGSVFLRSQGSGAPDSGDLYRMAIEIRSDEDGVDVKLPGAIKADPSSGRLTTVFSDLPQLPFETMHLHLKSGPRAPLINPATCGTQATQAVLSGWNGKVVQLSGKFSTSAAGSCERGFDPRLAAGTRNQLAGAASPFHLRLSREDRSQELGGLKVTLPPGLSGYLKGIPYCADAALAAVSAAPGTGAAQEASPSCPAASLIGTVTVGAGAGAAPFYTQSGRAYLAGPYKGAPLSMAVVAPAVAGPFDLGSVVVRNAIHVDPTNAQLTIVSDPLPSILQGIPLELRDVRVDVDRDHFTLNPTSCEPMTIEADVSSTSGASVHRSQAFQAAACERLRFEPRLSLRLLGPSHRAAHPRLRAVLRARPGEANIGKASVLLPKSELLENAHIRTVCTRVQYSAGAGGGVGCPQGSVYGYAKAWSPLLDQPLQGPVYLRSNGGERELPDLVASLGGQIHIDLVGYIDSVKERIRNRFVTVPDAPVSKFELNMQGGRKGLLANSVDLCRRRPRTTVLLDGQNGKIHDSSPLVKVDCGGAGRRKR